MLVFNKMFNSDIKVLYKMIFILVFCLFTIFLTAGITYYLSATDGSSMLLKAFQSRVFSSIMIGLILACTLLTIILLYALKIKTTRLKKEITRDIQMDVRQETIQTILKILEKHDKYTKHHSESVARLTSEFAEFLGMSEKKVQDLFLAGLFHDIGKILIPRSILNKPGKLSGQEFDLIKQHPSYAYDILIENSAMKDVAVYIKYHHEWFNGRGYPSNLKGEQIPFESRLLALADSWDAMTSNRIYKKEISERDALIVINENAGNHFDPMLVEKWIEFIEVKRIEKQKELSAVS